MDIRRLVGEEEQSKAMYETIVKEVALDRVDTPLPYL